MALFEYIEGVHVQLDVTPEAWRFCTSRREFRGRIAEVLGSIKSAFGYSLDVKRVTVTVALLKDATAGSLDDLRRSTKTKLDEICGPVPNFED